ncbi:MAG: hypothetical protein AAF620_05735 [Bacteroidota bacterium]
MERKYNFKDSVLLDFADQTVLNMETDLSVFSSFDSELDETKVYELKKAKEECLGVGTNESVNAKKKQLAAVVKDAMNDCEVAFSTIRYFARKAFKDQPAILRQFGFEEFKRIRHDQNKMLIFFAELEKTVDQYTEKLTDKGASEEIIHNVEVRAKVLAKAIADQKNFISQQPSTTSHRAKVFNELYDRLLEISDAAEIVFIGQSERRALYSLPSTEALALVSV